MAALENFLQQSTHSASPDATSSSPGSIPNTWPFWPKATLLSVNIPPSMASELYNVPNTIWATHSDSFLCFILAGQRGRRQIREKSLFWGLVLPQRTETARRWFSNSMMHHSHLQVYYHSLLCPTPEFLIQQACDEALESACLILDPGEAGAADPGPHRSTALGQLWGRLSVLNAPASSWFLPFLLICGPFSRSLSFLPWTSIFCSCSKKCFWSVIWKNYTKLQMAGHRYHPFQENIHVDCSMNYKAKEIQQWWWTPGVS